MINEKLNDKMLDAMLEVACGEIMADCITDPEIDHTDEHEFSTDFEHKMKKLFRHYNRSIKNKRRRKALSRAAIVLLVFMAAGFTLTLSVQALRVQFFNTVLDITDKYIGFSFRDKETQEASNVLYPNYLPDGYSEYEAQNNLFGTHITYTDNNMNKITYFQLIKHDGLNSQIDGEHLNLPYDISVNGVIVKVYESNTDEYANYLIWEDENTFFELAGRIEITELIKMVKSTIK